MLPSFVSRDTHTGQKQLLVSSLELADASMHGLMQYFAQDQTAVSIAMP